MSPEQQNVVYAESTFVQAPTGVLMSGISDRGLRTYLVLRSYVRAGHETFPKVETVAERFGLSESYLNRGIAELKKYGFLVVSKKSFAGNWRKVNLYYFPNVPDPQTGKSDSPGFGKSDRPVPGKSDRPAPSKSDTLIEVDETEVDETEVLATAKADAGQPAPKAKQPKWSEDARTVAKNCHDKTRGSLSFPSMANLAQWLITSHELTTAQAEHAIASVYQSGRAVTKQSLGQHIDGHSYSSRSKPTATDKAHATLELGRQLQAQQDAQKGIER